jgi:hypothetical protein
MSDAYRASGEGTGELRPALPPGGGGEARRLDCIRGQPSADGEETRHRSLVGAERLHDDIPPVAPLFQRPGEASALDEREGGAGAVFLTLGDDQVPVRKRFHHAADRTAEFGRGTQAAVTTGGLVASWFFGMQAHQDGGDLPLCGDARGQGAVALARCLHAVRNEGWRDEIGGEFEDHRDFVCHRCVLFHRGWPCPAARLSFDEPK